MNLVVAILLLALAWAAITAGFGLPNLLLGALIGGLALFLLRARFSRPGLLLRLGRLLRLAALFVVELAASAWTVALLVIRPDLAAHLRPAIIAFPLTARSDAEITLLANLITLTPGTLSIDVSPDRRLLYVHVLSLESREALVASLAGGFETQVIEVFA